MDYAYVANGAVVEGPCVLPKNWRNISNLDKMSTSQLTANGWLRYYKYMPSSVGPNQKVELDEVEVLSDRVIAHYIAVDKSQEEIDQETAEAWAQIRRQRNQLLLACDWTQLADSSADKESWSSYREALRNVPQSFINPGDVVWPTPPTT